MTFRHAILFLVLAAALLAVGCAKQKEVSFARDIQPLLNANCVSCHTPPDGEGYKASGFDLSGYGPLMKGTKFGSVIEPGSAISSTLVRLIEGKTHFSISMPRREQPLTPEQVQLVRDWIDQGAKNN